MLPCVAGMLAFVRGAAPVTCDSLSMWWIGGIVQYRANHKADNAHTDSIWSAVWAGAEDKLVTGSVDETVKVWCVFVSHTAPRPTLLSCLGHHVDRVCVCVCACDVRSHAAGLLVRASSPVQPWRATSWVLCLLTSTRTHRVRIFVAPSLIVARR